MNITLNAKYIKGPVTLSKGWYSNGRLAVSIRAFDGTPVGKVTVNLPNAPCPEGEAYVKSYAENEGLAEELLRLGLIEGPTHRVGVGYIVVDRYKIKEIT